MTAQAWIPPDSGLGHGDLPLWNMAMTHMGAPLPLGDTGASLRLSPIAAPHVTGPLHALQSGKGQTLYVHLDAFPYQDLLGVDFDLDAASDLPRDLADAIYAGSAEFLLHAFPDALTAGMTYQTIVADEVPQADDLKWFAAALDGLSKTSVFFSLGATADDICAFLHDKVRQPRPVLTALRETLDVTMHRVVGRARLDLDDVRNLGLGDFIVLEDATSADLALHCEDRTYYFETVEEGWRCTAVHPFEDIRKIPAMDDAPSDPQDLSTEAAPAIADHVSTVLTFECGEARVTLAELEGFQTGAIVPLPDQLTKDGVQVTIRAGAQPIATGEIVQIDDRIAVRISQLLTPTS
ncbi:MAG: FliM/FliN family flagellar motor switch protein [Pseudomonadota bacterium]